MQSKVTEYSVVESLDLRSLQSIVNKMIKDGWEPMGSLSVKSANNIERGVINQKTTYYQPMIKKGYVV